MDTENTDLADIRAEVRSAAHITARQWPTVIDADDAEQEIWLRLMENSERYRADIAARDTRSRIAVLRKIGNRVGRQYRDDYDRYSGNYLYGSGDVRRLLHSGILHHAGDEDITSQEIPDREAIHIDRTDTDTLSERIDVFRGLGKLHERNPDYVAILLGEFRDGKPVHQFSMELTRSVDALAAAMNINHRRRVSNYIEGPGTRTLISNEHARRVTSAA